MFGLNNTITTNITPKSLSEYLRHRYTERHRIFENYPYLLDELIVELHIRGFNTIGDVDKTLKRAKKAAELFEAENPPSRLECSRYSAIGIVRMSMLLLDNDFFTFRPTVFDNCLPERLEEYRKHILPETDETQLMKN
jgi:hypothetical protein